MSTYAIGDIQGCLSSLKALLKIINFNFNEDHLWLAGDLVNRGPDSLSTLRFVKKNSKNVTIILGNHDIHLIKLASKGEKKSCSSDTLDETLNAHDIQDLIDWLRHQPLFHENSDYALVHAGLHPEWSTSQAKDLAIEVQEQLRGPSWRNFMSVVYGNKPNQWTNQLQNHERWRVILNALTRLRVCSGTGVMDLEFKGGVCEIPPGFMPWFKVPKRQSRKKTIIFGHWSSLGLYDQDNVIGIDSGCVWGQHLTAVRLEDREIFQVSCVKKN